MTPTPRIVMAFHDAVKKSADSLGHSIEWGMNCDNPLQTNYSGTCSKRGCELYVTLAFETNGGVNAKGPAFVNQCKGEDDGTLSPDM